MNYEEKYKQALERARKELKECVHKDCDDTTRRTAITIIHNIFPELAESEDERIRKAILQFFESQDDNTTYSFVPKKDILTWLEKQGEKVTKINGEDYGIDGLYYAVKILEGTVGKVTGYQSDDGILEHKAAINAVKELYEKQGEQKIEMIKKACEWLKEEYPKYILEGCNGKPYILSVAMVDDFKKAMKGD